MTLIEFILSVTVVGMVVRQCVILVELRDTRMTFLLRESQRRQWVKEEHGKQ